MGNLEWIKLQGLYQRLRVDKTIWRATDARGVVFTVGTVGFGRWDTHGQLYVSDQSEDALLNGVSPKPVPYRYTKFGSGLDRLGVRTAKTMAQDISDRRSGRATEDSEDDEPICCKYATAGIALID